MVRAARVSGCSWSPPIAQDIVELLAQLPGAFPGHPKGASVAVPQPGDDPIIAGGRVGADYRFVFVAHWPIEGPATRGQRVKAAGAESIRLTPELTIRPDHVDKYAQVARHARLRLPI